MYITVDASLTLKLLQSCSHLPQSVLGTVAFSSSWNRFLIFVMDLHIAFKCNMMVGKYLIGPFV